MTVNDILKALYNRGLTDGYDRAKAELEAAINELCGSPEGGAPPAQVRPNGALRPFEQRVLGYLREHPGVTAHIARVNGVQGSALYALAKKGFARKEGPRFYALP